jgi:hypothetical protein
MSAGYYRLLPMLAASLSLLTAACGSDRPATGAGADPQAPPAPTSARSQPEEIDTESSIWTVLGLAKRPSQRRQGPQVGDQVNPTLWLAVHDTLGFMRIVSEDPLTGMLTTDWYSPPRKPAERLRISVFILSPVLRSDALSLTVERQERSPAGQWRTTPIDRDVVTDLESAILLRARHIRAERYRDTS